MLEFADGGPDNCAAARGLATGKIADLQARIADLQAMQDALARLVHTCEEPRERRECPLLAKIGGDG
ncbi:MAG: MerR family DNA-binding protein [Jiangellaceae bacterium]